MNIRTLHKSFINSRFPLIITLLIFIAVRILCMDEGKALDLWGSMFIQIGIALYLSQFTQKYVIIRQKTLLPTFFYLLLVGTNPLFFYDFWASVSVSLILLCFRFLFDTYQNPSSQRNALNISLVLALGSFYWVPLLLFIPLFWYGMYLFKSLNFKTFFASLMGLAMVCLFLLAWGIYKNDRTFFIQILPDWGVLWDFRYPSMISTEEWITDFFLCILLILSVVKIFMAGVSEKAQAKTFFGYLSLLTVVIFIFFLSQNQWKKEWLLILHLPVSIILAHYFTLSSKPVTAWLFVLAIVFFVLRFVWW